MREALSAQFAKEPASRELQVSLRGRKRYSQGLGNLGGRKCKEIAQIYHTGFSRIQVLQPFQRPVQVQNLRVARPDPCKVVGKLDLDLFPPPAPLGQVRPGVVGEDVPHQAGREGEEMRAVFERKL